MVVTHLVGNTRLLSNGVMPDTKEHKHLLMPLLWVCSNFRTVVSKSFYRVNTVAVNGEELATHFVPYTALRRLKRFYESMHHLVEKVHIVLDKRGVLTGEALEVLSRAPLDGHSFRQARKIKFTFFTTRSQELQWEEYKLEMKEANGAFGDMPIYIGEWSGSITRKWQ
ncbi:hypothetical protein GGI17_005898 [Coemansia sp. S146]|nr:hypothetical protein GGI17_005898 [Coemansia sp. S146]